MASAQRPVGPKTFFISRDSKASRRSKATLFM
jgi:hypothetical protein